LNILLQEPGTLETKGKKPTPFNKKYSQLSTKGFVDASKSNG